MKLAQKKLFIALSLAPLSFPLYVFAEDTVDSNQDSVTETQTVLVKGYTEKNPADVHYFPATTASVSATDIDTSINAMNTEDAVKYLPSINVRKRYIGDTNAPIATRTTGINASARSLIYADGVLLSTLVANNNGNGSPQWFTVSPQEIERIDVVYGPYSAAYAGNSYGGVVNIKTHMPTQFLGEISVHSATQDFAQYGSSGVYDASEYNLLFGNKHENFSWLISAEHLNSDSQPMSYGVLTQSTNQKVTGLPVLTGSYADYNRTGNAIQIIGAGNLNNSVQDTAKIKLAYDFTPTLTANYSVAVWKNDGKAKAETYLTDKNNAPYYGGTSGNLNLGGFVYSASVIAGQFSRNQLDEERRYQSFSLKSHDNDRFNWEILASKFDYLTDITRTSTGLYVDTKSNGAGRINDASGTGWNTVDANGSLTIFNNQLLSFGAHTDTYELVSPTYTTTNWASGDKANLFTNALGKTQTKALWLQDIIPLGNELTATLGLRYEDWQAYDGYNFAVNAGKEFGVNQPKVTKSGVSPKASLHWQIDELWTMTTSAGKALRFPTVGELYQNIQTGTTFTSPNPYLKPENVISEEVAFERKDHDSKVRISFFNERVSDAIISQTANISNTIPTPVAFAQNIDETHQQGVEVVAEKNNFLWEGFDLAASVTYVDGEIVANSSYLPTIAGTTSVGKNTPYIPKWRYTLLSTYHATQQLAFTLAGRYSSRQYGSVDNTDINAATYQGFQQYFVVDARAAFTLDQHWSGAFGVDNLNNDKYFLFHPFTQRTVFGEIKYRF